MQRSNIGFYGNKLEIEESKDVRRAKKKREGRRVTERNLFIVREKM